MLALENCRILDVVDGHFGELTSVGVQDGRFASLDGVVGPVERIDLDGAWLLPGLIDCHVHVTARATGNLSRLRQLAPSHVAAAAVRSMEDSLRRGFTRLRDTGGADWGLALAADEGYIDGPALHYCGPALSQTGGHGDMRGRGEVGHCCTCEGISQVADGVTAVRTAAREQLRLGASHVKLMLSGGVSSPTDKLDGLQYSAGEIRAAVEEATAVGAYVAGHAYTAPAVMRAIELGVRTIEHGNLADDDALIAIREAGAFLVPNLTAYHHHGRGEVAASWSADSLAKNERLFDAGMDCLSRAAGLDLEIAYGSDLLGSSQQHQSDEFRFRAQVQPMIDVVRSATLVGARLLGMEDRVGQIRDGFVADAVAVDRDPLQDHEALSRPERHVRLVMRDGVVRVDTTASIERPVPY